MTHKYFLFDMMGNFAKKETQGMKLKGTFIKNIEMVKSYLQNAGNETVGNST